MNILLLSILFSFLYNINEGLLKSNDIRNHLGSRTPYRFKGNKNDSTIKFSSCKDTKIWMIIRHGTRLPSPEDMIGANTTLKDLKYEILLHHKLGKGELNAEQLESFAEWSPKVAIQEERFLTLEGQDEMIHLAERMKNRFPGVIKRKYNNETFLFRYTATQRAQQSARYFTIGLFEKKDAQGVIYAPAAKIDPVLRFYKHCEKWQKHVKKNPSTYKEQKLFGISKQMNDTLETVSKRLGFNNVLTLDQVNIMYKTCGYETSWSKYHTSPWCYAFDEESIEILEYYHDLKHYWLDGYGHDLTYRQACVSIKNMFENFNNKEEPSATFLFAHSGTLLKILTHLELYKPSTPLTGDAIIKERPWRASNIDCFASNLAFVLFKCRYYGLQFPIGYRCRDGDHVLTLHQEHIIKLPMCETELCSLKLLRDYFHKSIFNCDYTDMCSLDVRG